MIISKIKNWMLDLLFPKTCVGCGKFGQCVCGECISKLKFLEKQMCAFCKTPNSFGFFCDHHSNNLYFDQLICSMSYKNEILKKMIISLKYKFNEDILQILGEILKTEFVYFSQIIPQMKKAILVPIPLHKKRLKFRGFNQSEKLANYLFQSLKEDEIFDKTNFSVEIADILFRKFYSIPQAKSNKQDRLTNLKNCFAIKKEYEYKIENKFIILIDDVATTLSTLNEASKVLKEHHPEHILAMTIARG
jgi:competence protein ComFC